jgi:hypothetical protein
MYGARLVARAITTAEDLRTTLSLDHIDHLHDALANYLMPDWLGQVSGLVDDLLILCDALSQDPDPATAAGAIELGKWARE